MRTIGIVGWCVGVVCLVAIYAAVAQDAQILLPFPPASDSFGQQIGSKGRSNHDELDYRFGSPNALATQAGNVDPKAGLGGGPAFGRPVDGVFNLSAIQTRHQTNSTQASGRTLGSGRRGSAPDALPGPPAIGSVSAVRGSSPLDVMGPAIQPPAPVFASPATNTGAAAAMSNPRIEAMRQVMTAQKQRADAAIKGAKAPAPTATRAVRGIGATTGSSSSAELSQAPAVLGRPAGAPTLLDKPAEAPPFCTSQGRSSPEQQAVVLLERGRAAEAQGRPGAARIYYQMVAERASGELKRQALARLAALRGT